MAKDNPRWGCRRIKGELQSLGARRLRHDVRTILQARRPGPGAGRDGPSWRQFLRAQAQGIVACDFFTVETVFLNTLHVLVFMHLQTRRILGFRVSANPKAPWMTQQARNLVMDLDDDSRLRVRFLVHDRDAKHCRNFDEVFSAQASRSCSTRTGRPKPTLTSRG